MCAINMKELHERKNNNTKKRKIVCEDCCIFEKEEMQDTNGTVHHKWFKNVEYKINTF